MSAEVVVGFLVACLLGVVFALGGASARMSIYDACKSVGVASVQSVIIDCKPRGKVN